MYVIKNNNNNRIKALSRLCFAHLVTALWKILGARALLNVNEIQAVEMVSTLSIGKSKSQLGAVATQLSPRVCRHTLRSFLITAMQAGQKVRLAGKLVSPVLFVSKSHRIRPHETVMTIWSTQIFLLSFNENHV